MRSKSSFAPAAFLAVLAAGSPLSASAAQSEGLDADQGAPVDDLDVGGSSDPAELAMLRAVRAEADRELDAICEAMSMEQLEELPDECLQALPELPTELVLCLAPDEVLFEGMAI